MHHLRAVQASLQLAGAAQFDAVTWHYLDLLAQRVEQQQGLIHDMLCDKLAEGLTALQRRIAQTSSMGHHATGASVGTNATASSSQALNAGPSPLAELLQDMKQRQPATNPSPAEEWQQENPRIQQFRAQLGRINVQKKVSKAMAQAPQNAGPINSHMLVLRSLGIMRDVSPDYLNRFMAHVDTLLCLDQAGQVQAQAKPKATPKPTPKAKLASTTTPNLRG